MNFAAPHPPSPIDQVPDCAPLFRSLQAQAVSKRLLKANLKAQPSHEESVEYTDVSQKLGAYQ